MPRLLPIHRLSDWPDCTIKVLCRCGRSSMPGTRLLAERHGDRPIMALAKCLRCEGCGARPKKVWLVAGFHRDCHGGPEPDWAVLLRAT